MISMISPQIAVSVIIPVYNVEKYIEQCLDSLICQTLKNIEIICVDDGSTDNTLTILEDYLKRDSRIQLIRQQNKFAGVARNNGMKHASGKYVIFLDSDDFFDETLLETTYNQAEMHNADVVLFGAKHFDDKTKQVSEAPWLFVKDRLPSELPFSPAATNGKLLAAFSPAPWTKLFSLKYIQKLNLEFMPLQNSNDVFFTYVAISCAERITYVDKSLVYYRVNTGTSLQNTKKKNPLCFLEAYYAVFKELKARNVYSVVEKGFRTAVADGCVYNYNSVDFETKQIIADSFFSDKFMEMSLLDGTEDDYVNCHNVKNLKHIIEAISWRRNLEQMASREDAALLIKNRLSGTPNVSVIIPCYNIDRYIKECLDSIQSQSLKDLEIICVNDGSTDNTLGLLLERAETDNRITVLSQKNAGQSFARNQGVKSASGKYIYFMDGDDILEPDALEVLYQTAAQDQLDVVYFDGVSFFESEELLAEAAGLADYYTRKYSYASVQSGLDMMLKMGRNSEYRESPCLQFIRREYFLNNDLWFIPGIVREDNAFSFKTMLLAKKVTHVPRTFFHRRVRKGSTMTSQIRFIHVYGQFVCYLDMLSVIATQTLTFSQQEAVSNILSNVIWNVRSKINQLPEEDWLYLQQLPPLEQHLFHTLAVKEIDPVSVFDFSTSASYRIGRAITFIPRMIRAFIRNFKQHGLKYTLKRTIQKLTKQA